MKKYKLKPSNLETCEFIKGINKGSIACSTCEFVENYNVESDYHGRIDNIEFNCNHPINVSNKWIKCPSTTISFILDGEPEKIHVIKTGFIDKYMVIYEDAYELTLGKVVFGTKDQIENMFKIKLNL